MHHFFKIEQAEIGLPLAFLEQDVWEIRSVPFNYEVAFCDEEGLHKALQETAARNGGKHFAYLDAEVARLYGKTIFKHTDQVTLTAVEPNKSMASMTDLIDVLQQRQFSKKEALLTAGGGITQDISAFVRAVYKRGIDWVYIPTTLLAMADSCIGAKACLNYGGAKNQLGLFSAPRRVYISELFLQTLQDRDVLSGYGEIIKLCIVGGRETVDRFLQLTGDQQGDRRKYIHQLLRLSLMVKKAVIELDEYEDDVRRALNYGHTVGHAIEPLVHYEIPHGIAVSIGMIAENTIAAHAGVLPAETAQYLNDLIRPFIDEASIDLLRTLEPSAVIDNMKKDKKNRTAAISMSVPCAIGHFDMLEVVPDEAFLTFFTDLLKNFK